MARYQVKFLKTVHDDTGHDVEICQRALEVIAASREEAAEIAKETFCKLEGVGSWTARADRVLAEEADFPS